MKRLEAVLVAMLAAVLVAGCASLESLGSLRGLVQPPTFSEAADQPAEIRLVGPGADRPIGGAVIRIWTRVNNPNAFGFRLATLRTTLLLDGTRAATGDFPLGLPLGPREETVVPLDLSISFSELAGLARVVRNAADGQAVPYQLDGTIGIDAGRLGQPTFGPMQLFQGELRSRVGRVGQPTRPARPTGSGDYWFPAAELVLASSGRICASSSASVICPGWYSRTAPCRSTITMVGVVLTP
jgi:hypothetical protein